MKRTPGRFAQTVIAMLIGLFLTQPVNAQWAVHVVGDTSPTAIKGLIQQTKQTIAQIKLVGTQDISLARQTVEYVKHALRWIETVNHYTNVIIQDVKRFTTLKGIMGSIEKSLGLDEDTLQALADIGQAIRGIYAVKNQFEALVRTRLRMVEALVYRAKNGIFDPAADLRDLEEYLRDSIGRSAQNVIATRERLARFDNELERWTFELGRARAREATISKELDDIKKLLEAELEKSKKPRDAGANEDGSRVILRTDGERVSVSADAINNLTVRRNQLEQALFEVQTEINKLIEKITERYKQYHQVFDESKITAQNWTKAQEGWEKFMELKDKALDKTIDNYGREQRPLGQ